eukprot:CAMPEP_0196656520 /NCGR_PEP_ID=MMETSP1086-20130531/17483_1 /TAXON_ID=77921 /ORGANISM="Cyanoptyche  gloeocystis , Strain SAG4.97" /LENGTH=85 /DNA_ID=CAMNT_0041989293 /DNA_START=1004 /DNA_END=1258 /DNA_ORIENTATION=-
MLGVGNSIADDVLKEDFEYSTSFVIDKTGDALHTTTASESADSRLGNALDIIAEDFPVTLGAALAEALATLSTAGHFQRRSEKMN